MKLNREIGSSSTYKLLACQILLIFWHSSNNPIWITLLAPLFCLWRGVIDKKEWKLPPNWITTIISLILFTGIYLHFGAIMARDPGLGALTILSSVKMLEIRGRRDYTVSLYLCFFLVFAQFLFDDTIATLLVTLFFTLYLTALLIEANSGKNSSIFPFLKKALLFQSAGLPFVLLLFFFFPRTSFSILSFDNNSAKGKSGLSSTLEPGSIADVVKDGSTAFRVTFNNFKPKASDLYFRGLVMWFTDGSKWYSRVKGRPFRRRGRKQQISGVSTVEQEILLEPHFNNWVFAMDHPVWFSKGFYEKAGHVFITGKVVSQIKYRVQSLLNPIRRADILDSQELRWSLQLPADFDTRLRNLGQDIVKGELNPEKQVEALLGFYRNNGFEYTLNPGKMEGDSWGYDFLTESKRGFCSHFATTFVLLARSLKIPSRVVTGFQGGDYNPVGEYYIVRNSHAHAWCEVFLNSRWVRLDPTALVAPYRIEGVGTDTENSESKTKDKGVFRSISLFFENHWDNLNSIWYKWVIGFDNFQQQEFLKMLNLDGVGAFRRIGQVSMAGAFILLLVFMIMKPSKTDEEKLNRIYLSYQKRVGKKGLKKESWEGPVDFQNRFVDNLSGKSEIKGVIQFTDLYCRINYGRERVDSRNLRKLKKLLRKL